MKSLLHKNKLHWIFSTLCNRIVVRCQKDFPVQCWKRCYNIISTTCLPWDFCKYTKSSKWYEWNFAKCLLSCVTVSVAWHTGAGFTTDPRSPRRKQLALLTCKIHRTALYNLQQPWWVDCINSGSYDCYFSRK